MPLYYNKTIDDHSSLCIWEITESFEELFKLSGINNFTFENKNKKRQLEYIATLFLAAKIINENELPVEMHTDENGKPHLTTIKKNISVSHTKQFVAVYIHDKKFAGVDIEMISLRIEKISQRFLSETEKKWIKPENHLEQLFIIWGAKECAFKIYSKGGIDFKEMLEVKEFDYSKKGETTVTLKKNNVTCGYPVCWENLNGLMVVYGVGSNQFGVVGSQSTTSNFKLFQ